MQFLDNIAAEKPQLSRLELTLLSTSVAAAACGPILFTEGYKIAEVLAPAAAACKFQIFSDLLFKKIRSHGESRN